MFLSNVIVLAADLYREDEKDQSRLLSRVFEVALQHVHRIEEL